MDNESQEKLNALLQDFIAKDAYKKNRQAIERLYDAVEKGNCGETVQLITEGIDFGAWNECKLLDPLYTLYTDAFLTLRDKNLDSDSHKKEADACEELCAYINSSQNRKNIITHAVICGNLNILKYIVDNAAKINIDMASELSTALPSAAGGGRLGMTRFLMETEIECGLPLFLVWKALCDAFNYGHLDIVEYLASGAPHMSEIYAERKHALENEQMEYFNQLVELSDIIDDCAYEIIGLGRLDLLKIFVEKGLDINYIIHTVIEQHRYDAYFDPDIGGYELDTTYYDIYRCFLDRAVESGHLDTVKYLVEHGADVNIHGGAPLRSAAGCGNIDMLRYLVEKGAHINSPISSTEKDLQSPSLDCAVKNGLFDNVKLLVEHGACICASSIEAAASQGHSEILKYLFENKNSSLSFTEEELTEALEGAASCGCLEAVKLLADKGADITGENYNDTSLFGRTRIDPLGSAAKSGNLELVRYLFAKGAIN